MTKCILRACPKLTHLHFGGIRHLSDCDVREAILKPLSKTLVSLTLSGGLFSPMIESPILQTLNLAGSIDLRGLHPKSFCPALDTLDLSYCGLLGQTSRCFPDEGLCLPEQCLSMASKLFFSTFA